MDKMLNFIKKNAITITILIIVIMIGKSSLDTLARYGYIKTCIGVIISVMAYIFFKNLINEENK